MLISSFHCKFINNKILNLTDKNGIKNTTNECYLKEDDHRDDDCVIVDNEEMRNDIEDKQEFNINQFHLRW